MTQDIASNLILGAIALNTFFSGVGVLWIGSLIDRHLKAQRAEHDSADGGLNRTSPEQQLDEIEKP